MSHLAWKDLRIPQEELESVTVERNVWVSFDNAEDNDNERMDVVLLICCLFCKLTSNQLESK